MHGILHYAAAQMRERIEKNQNFVRTDRKNQNFARARSCPHMSFFPVWGYTKQKTSIFKTLFDQIPPQFFANFSWIEGAKNNYQLSHSTNEFFHQQTDV